MQAAAGGLTVTLVPSDMITLATAIVIPSVIWVVNILLGLKKSMEQLNGTMHRLEVNIIREQAASGGRSTKNILFALAGKHPSTDPESVKNASDSAESASDTP